MSVCLPDPHICCQPHEIPKTLNYLTAQQQAGNVLSFHLLNGEVFHGRVIGFSPYAITIQQEADGVQMMVQKLALAYYSAPPQEANT